MARQVLETAVGLPDGACRLLCALSLLDAQGEVVTRDRLASLLGVHPDSVSRTMRALIRLGVISRFIKSTGHAQGTEYTWKISHNVQPVSVKRDENGKAKKCQSCRALNPAGVFCEVCKQKKRADRAWNADALRIAQCIADDGKEVSAYRVQAELVKRGYLSVPLWDKPTGANDRVASGLVSILLEAGLLPNKWRTYQRRALRGEDADG